MTLTANFRDYQAKKIIGKRGGVTWGGEWIDVVDTLHPVNPKNYPSETFYVRGRDMGKDVMVSLYNADGSYVMGNWRHGRYGTKIHEEMVSYWIKSNRIAEVTSYASGQIKDQHKYLLGIKK